MSVNKLPDLTDWQKVEVWTIDEAALLWAALDPMEIGDTTDFDGCLENYFFGVEGNTQVRKAKIYRRAIVEAICNGALSFTKAVEVGYSYNGDYEVNVSFPNLPDPDKISTKYTRITQAAFIKWAKSKNIPSYRVQLATEEERERTRGEDFQLAIAQSIIEESAKTLLLPAPSLLTKDHPMAATELIVANEIWEIVANDKKMHANGKPVKKNLLDAINDHPKHKSLSNDAKERICTVANWRKKGGATKTP